MNEPCKAAPPRDGCFLLLVCCAQDNAAMLKSQLEQQSKAVDTILGNMRVLESKLAEVRFLLNEGLLGRLATSAS